MGRKRLLTILAAVGAALTLQANPAAAQLSVPLPGVGEITVGSGDRECLEVGVDVSLGDLVGLDPKVCVLDGDGKLLDVEGKLKAGEQEVDLGEATGAASREEKPAPASTDDRQKSAEPGEQQRESDRDAERERGSAEDAPVAAAGEARPIDPQQEARAEAFAALRADLAAVPREAPTFGPLSAGVPATGSVEDLAAGVPAPEVADDVRPGIGAPAQRTTPEISAPTRQDALLAAEQRPGSGVSVPASLQLLAGAMVLGSAGVWFLARREYGTVTTATG